MTVEINFRQPTTVHLADRGDLVAKCGDAVGERLNRHKVIRRFAATTQKHDRVTCPRCLRRIEKTRP